MATLEKEDFWGCELKKGSVEVKFNPEFEDSDLSQVDHKLILSQACLGAKANGRCLVEVTAHDYKGEEQKHVIASLQPGSTEMCPLNLSFNPPATFKLIAGTGPVHLTGNHIQSLGEDELDSSEESDEDEAPQLVESKPSMKNKRPLSSTSTPTGPPKKIAKTNKDKEEDDEDEEESSDEEEEETPAKPAPAKKDNKKKPQKKENEKEDEEDEDDDDESDEEDDDDDEKDEDFEGSDDEEESEEESEEEESESDEEEESDEVTKMLTRNKDSPKKSMTNGISSKKDDKKPQQKTPLRSDKPKDVDSVKKALLKSPALPKKMDKFKNLLRSSYKITDEATVKDIWEYVQNNKK